MVDKIRYFDGKKFLWDGREFDSEEKAELAAKEYREKDFEVQLYREEKNVFLYTRRVVTEIVIE
jgi:hypothetical protein